MTKKTITSLSGILSFSGISTGDFHQVIDISDTTLSANGTNKKVPHSELRIAMGYPTDTTVSFSTPYTLDANTVGFNAIIRMSLTNTLNLEPPSNGVVGQRVRLFLLASGGTRTIVLNSGIIVPDGITFSGSVSSGDSRLIELEKHSFGWLVIRNLQFTP